MKHYNVCKYKNQDAYLHVNNHANFLYIDFFKEKLQSQKNKLTSTPRFIIYEWTIMASTLAATFGPPIGFALMILNPNQALNRFFQYLFGYNPRNHPLSMIIVMIFSANATLKGAAVMDFFLNTAVMYMQFQTFWISAITPIQVVKEGRRCVGRKIRMNPGISMNRKIIVTYHQNTALGLLSQPTIFQFYKCHQIVNTGINEVYKFVAFHHGVVLLMWAMSAFACIRMIGRIKVISLMFMFGALVICNWIILFEVYFVAGVSDIGKRFLKSMEQCQVKGTQDEKIMKSLWNLNLKTSYPFFNIENVTFIEFLKIASDLTVTLLLDLELPEMPWIGFDAV
jgi:hypothetical protein